MAKLGKGATQAAGRAATKIFPVGKLFRRAGGRRRGDPIVGREGGRRAGNQGRREISQQEGWRRAAEARDDAHRRLVRDSREAAEGAARKEARDRARRLDKARQKALRTGRAGDWDKVRQLEGQQIRNQRDMDELVDDLHATNMKKHSVVTGATDPETGLSAGGYSGSAGGGWGCAEKNALDNLNAMRAERGMSPLEPTQVDFSKAEWTRTIGPPSDQAPICRSWCQRLTHPEQYPDDIKYQGSTVDGESPWENQAGSRR